MSSFTFGTREVGAEAPTISENSHRFLIDARLETV